MTTFNEITIGFDRDVKASFGVRPNQVDITVVGDPLPIALALRSGKFTVSLKRTVDEYILVDDGYLRQTQTTTEMKL